jgi:hypothetical protein
MQANLPPHYAAASRTVLRYVVIMAIFGMLTGVLYQESAKKLPDAAVQAGIGLDSVLSLALVHGHVLVTAVVLPLVLCGAMHLARISGGSELTTRATWLLTRGYLPFVTGAVLLMIYKGYHALLAVRGGEMDFLAIDATYFGGATIVRHAVYGVVHTGMFVSMSLFLIAIWRSLKAQPAA